MSTAEPLPSVAILGGCGHVGLPLGLAMADVGMTVTLVDTSLHRRDMVARGELPFMEQGGAELLPRMLEAGRLLLSGEMSALVDVDVVVLTIGTPVDEFMNPAVGGFDRTVEETLVNMRDGQLLIIRSTIFPGVADRVAAQVARTGPDVDVAYCPERIAQGFALVEIKSIPQIVSGASERAAERAAAFFSHLTEQVVTVTPREAELAKLFSNAYRYINFAIANQFYMLTEREGASYERVHAAATLDYPRMAGLAMSGFAGGPCLLKDTMQLAAFSHQNFPLGQAAMVVNEGLPSFLVEQLAGTRDLSQDTVAVLGMAFKGNSDDPRSSLSYKLKKVLELRAKRVICTDPHVEDPSFVSLETCLEEADVLIIGTTHREYKNLKSGKPIVDVFGFVERGES